MRNRIVYTGCIITIAVFLLFSQVLAQEEKPADAGEIRLHLDQAVIAEGVKDLVPKNPGVLFSVSSGSVCCFTVFDTVPEKTFIYHNWFYRDRLSARIKLMVQPPRWSTFSNIQLRDTDKGPWRVEVTDQDGKVLSTLRFSITD